MPTADYKPTQDKHRIKLTLDLRIVVALLLVVIGAMLFLWKPWDSTDTSDRTISVTGEATLKAEPDEYLFSPNYEIENTGKETTLAALVKKSDEIVSKLKGLGVPDNRIKTNATGYKNNSVYYPETYKDAYVLTVSVTISSKELAQKVQDYLVTTSPSGQITPQPNFSEAKRKQLESRARDAATKDARAKAEQSAKNLGFKVASVKSVSDGSGFDYPVPLGVDGAEPTRDTSVSTNLDIQPGENELRYSVTVIYYIR